MRRRRRSFSGWSSETGAHVAPREEAAYHLDSGATSSPHHVRRSDLGEWSGETSSGTPNSSRAYGFLLLSETISRLAELPQSDPLCIDKTTATYANNLIGLMRSTFEISPPRVFTQDAEALVMTWDDHSVAKLLTIAGEEVSLIDLHKGSQLRCYHEVADGSDAMPSLIPILSQSSIARSSVADDE